MKSSKRRRLASEAASERDAAQRDDADHRILIESALIGGSDLVEPRPAIGIVRHRDDEHLASLLHELHGARAAPLAARVDDSEAVWEPRRDLAVEEAPPCRLPDFAAALEAAAEDQLGPQLRPRVAGAGRQPRRDAAGQEENRRKSKRAHGALLPSR